MSFDNNEDFAKDLEQKKEEANPPMFQVMIHNDDFTPKDFVIDILVKFFFMDRKSAEQVMLASHIQGRAGCGVYAKDYAESKVSQVLDYARSYENPLICSAEAAL